MGPGLNPALTIPETEMTMTNALFSTFKTDTDVEVTGKWVYPVGDPTDDNPNQPGFKIARAGGANKKYTRVQQNYMKPHQAILRNLKDLTPERLDLLSDITKKCFFDAVLLDWKNVFNEKGEAIPFTRANAEDLMKQLPALYEQLNSDAASLSTFNISTPDEDAGN